MSSLISRIIVACGTAPLLTAAFADTQPNVSQNRRVPAATVELTKGQRPPNPGGSHYFEHRNGFWGRVDSVAFSPDGRFLLSAGAADGTVRLWDVATGEELRRYQGKGHSSQYDSVAFSPDGQYVLGGSCKRTGPDPHAAWLWDIDTTEEIQRFVGHTTHYVGGVDVEFSPDGQHILTTCVDGPALVWEVAKAAIVHRLGDGVGTAAFSPDGKEIATGNRSGEIKLWNARSGAELRAFRIDGSLRFLAYSIDSQRLLALPWKGNVRYLDAKDGQVIHQFPKGGSVHSGAISPDSRHALLGTSSKVHPSGGLAELYSVSSGGRVRTFEQQDAYDGWVSAVAFSPNGQFVATGCLYGPIRLWEVESGKEIRAFYGHLGEGPDVSFSGDDHVCVNSWCGPLEEAGQRAWLERVRKQQEVTVPRSPGTP